MAVFSAAVRGIIVEILDFIWLRGGGHLFCGGGEIMIEVHVQGVIVFVGIYEVFACEVGLVKGAGDLSG